MSWRAADLDVLLVEAETKGKAMLNSCPSGVGEYEILLSLLDFAKL